MNKEFINCDTIRDNTLKLAHHMYKNDGFIPDIIYASLRGGAYMANVFSEYYKMVKLNRKERPVFYAAVVARSYGYLRNQSRVMVDGWTYSPEFLRSGDKILLVDDIFDTGKTVNALGEIIMQKGIPRNDLKIVVYDYKVPLYKKGNPSHPAGLLRPQARSPQRRRGSLDPLQLPRVPRSLRQGDR